MSSGATIDARTGQVAYPPDDLPPARCLAWTGGHFCAETATPGHVHRCCCDHTWETG